MSTEGIYRATSRTLLKQIRREIFEKSLVDYKGHMLFIGSGVPKFELLGTPAREFSKTGNLVSTEDTYRATGKKIKKEIRRENFEKSIVEKGSLLPTNDHIETGTKVRALGYPTEGVFKEMKLGEYRWRVQRN